MGYDCGNKYNLQVLVELNIVSMNLIHFRETFSYAHGFRYYQNITVEIQ